MGSLSYETEKEWHDIRLKHIGASESAALFSMSPFMTKWQLHMVKTGNLPAVDLSDNAAVNAGKFMEDGLRAWAESKFGITLQKTRRYLVDDTTPGMGCSLDYEQIGTGARIPCEMKFSQFGKSDQWDWDGSELTRIPDHYALQLQHQLSCANAREGRLIAFVGGDLRWMTFERSEKLITAIRAAVAQFWSDVRAGKEPPVDFSADADAVNRLAYIRKLRSVTLLPEADDLFRRWHDAKRVAAEAERQETEAKTAILKMIVDAGEGPDTSLIATCGKWRLALSKIADNPGKVITAEMIGETFGARRGHLRATLKRVEE